MKFKKQLYREWTAGSFSFKGLYRNKLNEVLAHVVKVLIDKGHPVDIHRPFWSNAAVSLGDFKDALDEHFANNSKAVAIIGYAYCKNAPNDDYYEHWTTIIRKTTKTLFTFDSSDERKLLPLSMCRIWDDKQSHTIRPYKIQTTETFFLSGKKN